MFFTRDLITLLRNGINIDIFPIYPIKHSNWKYIPIQWREEINDRVNIRYLSPLHCEKIPDIIRNDVGDILAQSISFGSIQWLKSYIVIRQALKWRKKNKLVRYDYLLSYWGNYAATYAYLCVKLIGAKTPFSFFLHAGTDLYRDQIYLREKINFSRNVFTVCEFNKLFLRQLYPEDYSSFEDKIILHHLGLDLENFELDKPRSNNILLTVGHFGRPKGFEYAIHAMPIVLNKFPGIQLHMIGEGEEKRRLVKLVRKLGIQDSVHFFGWLPFEHVKTEMEKSTILIHPSIGLGDAVPTVIKEALALGLPVIGSDIVGIPELLDNGRHGILIQPNDSHLLANSIISLLENESTRKKFGIKGRDFAERHFNMWHNGKKLSELIMTTDINLE